MWRFLNKGFTQVELLVGLAVMGLASAVGFEAVRQNTKGFERLSHSVAASSKHGVALALLRDDFRNATLHRDEFYFVGKTTKVRFVRTGTSPNSFLHVTYETNEDSLTGQRKLWREVSQGRRTLLENHLSDFELSYFDGSQWLTTWGDANGIRGLPLVVKVKSEGAETLFPVMVSVLNRERR